MRALLDLMEAAGTSDLTLYHGTSQSFERFAPYSHFGTLAQARMRHSKRIIAVTVKAGRFKRLRDTGDWKRDTLRAYERQGFDGVVYLNRYEGIPLAQFDAAYAEIPVEKLDRLPDAAFQKLVPAAADSYIVFDPRRVTINDIV